MKRKNILISIIALILALALIGCGGGKSAAASTPAPTAEPTAEPTPEPKKPMDTADLAEYVQARTVTVNVTDLTGSKGTGSGFFIDNQGTIVTNFHVIDMATELTVEVADGGTYNVAKIVDFSNVYDLAILKIDMVNTPYLEIASEPARTGEQVYAVGSALGTLTGSFTGGMVSSTTREYGKIQCYQMDAAISSGNSGGPLVNVYGEVVGVNTASYTSGENLNLAIKIAELDRLERNKNMSVTEFTEWYEQESRRSWSPYWIDTSNKYHYCYSLVRNYETVTGVSATASKKNAGNGSENGETRDGYYDCFDCYAFPYDTDSYDKYTEYLRSVGFTYQGSETQESWVGESFYYYNEKDSILVDMFVLKDSSEVWIWPTVE